MSTWDLTKTKHHVFICNGGSCSKMGGEEVTLAIRQEIQRQQADDLIHTTRTRCNGRCEDACVVIVYPEGTWYRNLQPADAAALVGQHLLAGKPLDHLLSHRYADGSFLRMEGAAKGTFKRSIPSQ
ncbi:(2Fe-2S) ferredoxin domain-containing protein [Brevibacillus humidisoli]|uniref:(2Fe-2S) ferredoxin domain-containing protein n=1 Tax=Brevibacillus humidisoli TaxID=2895522 RepID=UPI001E543868|nr:(2Fe-2S) ferredoxin domain-containing protein [Brevibacillus humidisoli]UFJ39278.1 (2Fe-2S) ferredoxin domain-containing protein [Brevibacillus humidisoli]